MRYLINENVWTDTHILFEKKKRLIISQRTEVSLILTPQLTAETQTYYHYCPHEAATDPPLVNNLNTRKNQRTCPSCVKKIHSI